MVLADRSNRRFADGSYGQLSYSFQAVRCLDSQDDSVRRPRSDTPRCPPMRPCSGRVAGPD